jgi:two-component system sensor histidine kinase MtrB
MNRSAGNTSDIVLTNLRSGALDVTAVSPELQTAVGASPGRQQTQMSEVTIDGEDFPAVIVGSVVEVPNAGPYDLYFIYPMTQEVATMGLIGNAFVVAGVILTLLVGAVAWVVTRQVVAPVRRAGEVAQRLSAGKLNERMPTRGEDDLALLATSFNGMADSLQSQIRQLEGLSAVQQRFVSDVSHELRTPLTTIRMAVDLIHESRVDFDPSVARSAELLAGELDRFEDLLSDLLEISRFDAGAAALDIEPVDVRGTIAKVVEAARPLAERRGSLVTVHAPDEPAEAEVDERRVERILRNLVVNAIEHGDGRPVDLHVAVGDDAVAVVVEDHGVGLRPGEAANVFTRFWRADPARARTTGGTGLGLSISLEDARLHNGWLQAWGERGVGSRFRLTLPQRAGGTLHGSPLPLSPTEDP